MSESKYWIHWSPLEPKNVTGPLFPEVLDPLWITQFHLLFLMRFVLALCHSILWSPLHTTFSIFATVQKYWSRLNPPPPNKHSDFSLFNAYCTILSIKILSLIDHKEHALYIGLHIPCYHVPCSILVNS